MCLCQLLLACKSLEHLTVETGSCVQHWAEQLVAWTRIVQRQHGEARALRCLEVISSTSLTLPNLWCVRAWLPTP